jgi:MarR family.
MNNEIQSTAELICELTRLCVIKEEKFAASFNLSPTELKLLKLFDGAHMHKVSDLVKMLKLTPGRITHILTSLEEKKLVLRLPDETDKEMSM